MRLAFAYALVALFTYSGWAFATDAGLSWDSVLGFTLGGLSCGAYLAQKVCGVNDDS